MSDSRPQKTQRNSIGSGPNASHYLHIPLPPHQSFDHPPRSHQNWITRFFLWLFTSQLDPAVLFVSSEEVISAALLEQERARNAPIGTKPVEEGGEIGVKEGINKDGSELATPQTNDYGCWCNPWGIAKRIRQFSNTKDSPTNIYSKSERFRFNDSSMFAVSLCSGMLGVANLGRFPYYLYFYNGFPFLVAYLVVSLTVVLPIVHLHVALGQVVQGGIVQVIESISTRLRGLSFLITFAGFVSMVTNSFDIMHLVVYAFNSFTESFPWRPPVAEINKCLSTGPGFCIMGGQYCGFNDLTETCKVDQIDFAFNFYESISVSNGHGAPLWPLLLLVALWLFFVVLALRGIGSIFTIGLWTISITFVVLVFLFSFGSSLQGAEYSLSVLFGGAALHEYFDAPMWSFATIHAIHSLCVSNCILATFGGYNKPNASVQSSVMSAFSMNFIISCLAGFAVYPYLGYLRYAISSFGLLGIADDPQYIAFSVFPLALSFLPGAPVFCFLFFFTATSVSSAATISQLIALANELHTTRLLHRVPRGMTVVGVGVAGLALALLTSSYPVIFLNSNYLGAAATQVGLCFLSLLFVFAAGWISSSSIQASSTGRLSVALMAFGFFSWLCGLSFILQTSHQSLSAFAECCGGLLVVVGVAVALGGCWRRRRHSETWMTSIRESSWWLLLGNIDLLRATLNEITVGQLPVDDAIKQSTYGVGFACFGHQRFRRSWSLGIKYVSPVCLTIALNFQFLHIRSVVGFDSSFGIHCLQAMFATETERALNQYWYTVTIYIIASVVAVGAICPGLFSFFAPVRRISHRTHWKGAYELPLLQVLKKFGNIFNELGPLWPCCGKADNHYDDGFFYLSESRPSNSRPSNSRPSDMQPGTPTSDGGVARQTFRNSVERLFNKNSRPSIPRPPDSDTANSRPSNSRPSNSRPSNSRPSIPRPPDSDTANSRPSNSHPSNSHPSITYPPR